MVSLKQIDANRLNARKSTGPRSEEGKLRPLDVKEGDRILFGKYSGTEIKLDGEDFIIMRRGSSGHPDRRGKTRDGWIEKVVSDQ